jgi:hypothetical protein
VTPERIGDDVRREFGRFGPAGAIADVVAAWPDAVGDQIAQNAWPARIARDGTLHVATSSSAWAFELGMLEDDIRGRLADALGAGAPSKLRFAPGPLPEPDVPERDSAAAPPPAVTHQHEQAGEELAAQISDENLRKVVARAAAASLARPRDDRPI